LSATPFASFRAVDAAIEGLQSVKLYSWVDVMEHERNSWEKTFSPRIIQRKIGQVLKAQYDQDLAQPLPHRLLTLLMLLNEQQNTDRDKRLDQTKPAR
jgi:anti-sigma factor NepR-like protein